MNDVKTAHDWTVKQLRDLVDNIENQRVLAFRFCSPADIVICSPEDGDTMVRRALTGVKALHVTYTEHPLAVDRVDVVHDRHYADETASEDEMERTG